MLPGLASGPKNTGLEARAFERLTNSDVLPSNPTIVLDSVTWKATPIFSVVIFASPFAAKTYLAAEKDPDKVNAMLTIHPVWLIWIPGE